MHVMNGLLENVIMLCNRMIKYLTKTLLCGNKHIEMNKKNTNIFDIFDINGSYISL